jgi:hypothetical protein
MIVTDFGMVEMADTLCAVWLLPFFSDAME